MSPVEKVLDGACHAPVYVEDGMVVVRVDRPRLPRHDGRSDQLPHLHRKGWRQGPQPQWADTEPEWEASRHADPFAEAIAVVESDVAVVDARGGDRDDRQPVTKG